MKEATGELNMTVVTIVAIAALLAFFYLIIWPGLQAGMAINSACNTSNGGKTYTQGFDGGAKVECGNGSCTYTNSKNQTTTRTCETTDS